MFSVNFKIEHFFLFSLLAWFLVGYQYFLNLILIIQLISIFFFFKFQNKLFKINNRFTTWHIHTGLLRKY